MTHMHRRRGRRDTLRSETTRFATLRSVPWIAMGFAITAVFVAVRMLALLVLQ